jgi:hypothetical protein
MGGIAKLLLVLTSLAPGVAVYGFATWLLGASFGCVSVWVPLLAACILTFSCIRIVNFAADRLPRFSVEVAELKSADSEIVGFALAYVLPILTATTTTVNLRLLILGFCALAALVWGTNSYHTNPLLSVLGYHFYEIMSTSGLTFVVLSKRTLRQVKTLTSVAFMTDYMALDLEGR